LETRGFVKPALSPVGVAAAECKVKLAKVQSDRRLVCTSAKDSGNADCIAANAVQKKAFKECRKTMKAWVDEQNMGFALAEDVLQQHPTGEEGIHTSRNFEEGEL
jgi:hypothetical protein